MSAPKAPRLYFLLERAAHVVREQVERRTHEGLGVGSVQLGALFHLVANDGCRHKELASALGVLPSAVSGLVARMEAKGLVDRRVCADDARAERLRATASGRRFVQQALPIVAEMQAALSAGFTEAEIAIVGRFLTAAIEKEIWPATSDTRS